jgi:hypothetical protein
MGSRLARYSVTQDHVFSHSAVAWHGVCHLVSVLLCLRLRERHGSFITIFLIFLAVIIKDSAQPRPVQLLMLIIDIII